MQLVQQRILATRTVLMVDQNPVEAGEAGNFDGDR
jgi:hypothetical protein